jgi:hypothetical protein
MPIVSCDGRFTGLHYCRQPGSTEQVNCPTICSTSAWYCVWRLTRTTPAEAVSRAQHLEPWGIAQYGDAYGLGDIFDRHLYNDIPGSAGAKCGRGSPLARSHGGGGYLCDSRPVWRDAKMDGDVVQRTPTGVGHLYRQGERLQAQCLGRFWQRHVVARRLGWTYYGRPTAACAQQATDEHETSQDRNPPQLAPDAIDSCGR